MTVERRIALPEVIEILHRAWSHLAGLADHGPKIGKGRVDDWNCVPFRKHQSVGRGQTRVFRYPPHGLIHEAGHDVAQTQGGGGMTAA